LLKSDICVAEYITTKRLVAVKIEHISSPHPLIIYEANVTLILHGI
jgi:serine/threonine protein kinase